MFVILLAGIPVGLTVGLTIVVMSFVDEAF